MIKSCFSDKEVDIATLICKDVTSDDLTNPNQIKTVISLNGDALYFSRSVVPYIRDYELHEWINKHTFYKHLGLYGYKKVTLKKLTQLNRSSLEIAESLEQNRWLENGYKIRTAISDWDSYGIDSPEDLVKVRDFFNDKV
jgi:3-deoxy-manno-octulosonate cytidylyltransferase (CMP-KDO synthetase)